MTKTPATPQAPEDSPPPTPVDPAGSPVAELPRDSELQGDTAPSVAAAATDASPLTVVAIVLSDTGSDGALGVLAAPRQVRTRGFPIKARQVQAHTRKDARMPATGPQDLSVQGEADRLMLREFAPAAGKANWNGHAMVREREEMLASEEELRAANEELQSTNEELQSANEELNTSKEEMQSMNEELQTVNGELEIKLDDLAMAKSDLRNLLVSTDAATLFLDSALRVRRFNDQATRLINLREGDAGRPLTDLTSTLDYPQLLADVQDTLRTLAPHETQVRAAEGRWFNARIIPYRTIDKVIDGAVVSFVDVTAQRAAMAGSRTD